MSQITEQQIEQQAETLIDEAIAARNGLALTDQTQLITFIAVICSNASTLQQIDFKKLPIEEQTDIALFLFQDIYQKLLTANLIPINVKNIIDQLSADSMKLRAELNSAIVIYDLTTQITGLPSFHNVERSSFTALKHIFGKLHL